MKSLSLKQAFLLFQENRYKEALELYPDYPMAHISSAELMRQEAFKNGWAWTKENIINHSFKSCPNSIDVYVTATDLAMRFEKYEEAIKYAEYALKHKPENPVSLSQLINIMREMGIRSVDEVTKIHYFNQARKIAYHLRNVSTQHFKEATDLIYAFNAQIP